MGIIKDNNYSEQELEIAKLFDAVSHPARKRILDLLQVNLVLRNTDLSSILNLTPTAVRNHLNKLKETRIIETYYDIHHHEIVLNPERLRLISDYLEKFYGSV